MATVSGGVLTQEFEIVGGTGSSSFEDILASFGGSLGETSGETVEVTTTSRATGGAVELLSTEGATVEKQGDATIVKAPVTSATGASVEATVVAVAGTGAEATVTVSVGGVEAAITVPAGATISGQGAKTTTENANQLAQEFVADLARSFGLSDESSAGVRDAYNKTIAAVAAKLEGVADSVAVALYSLGTSSDTRAVGDITITGTAAAEGEAGISVLDMLEVDAGVAVNVSNMDSILLVGAGELVVTDNTDTSVYGDAFDQMIAGGTGNDTLVGGGGTDSLMGGSGDDQFGFNTVSHFVIEDFTAGDDSFNFGFGNINSLEELLPFLTSAENVDGNAVYTFLDGDASITLTGVTTDEVTAAMLNFDL